MSKQSAYAFVADLFKANPGKSDDELFALFWTRGQSVMQDMARNWFRHIIALIRAADARRERPPARVTAVARQESVKASEMVSRVRAKVIVQVQSLLDTIILRDGRKVGDVHWYELGVLARENEHEAALLRAIMGFCQVNDDQAKVRDVVSAGQMETLVEKLKVAA